MKYMFIPHPYEEWNSSKTEKWAEFSLEIVDDRGNVLKSVFEWQWDILVFLQWFIDNKDFLFEEKYPIFTNKKSIAFATHQFYQTLGENDASEEIIDAVYDYRTRHDLRFALRGTDIKSILLGLKDKAYTVSTYSQNEFWEYEIDLNKFYLQLEKLHYFLVSGR